MADYWVSSELADGDNDGSSPANAIRGASSIKTAFEVVHAAGTKQWIRRTSVYDEGVAGEDADILPTADGAEDNPIYAIGWPRAAIPNTTITEGDWTNGSTTVDNIVGITCARTAHQARWTTAPDGHKYLITRVVDANTIIIDREYAGGTVTGVDGKFQIEADEDYADRPQAGIDAGWDADAHDIPTIDFNDEAYELYFYNTTFWSFRNLNFIDSNDASGIFYVRGGTFMEILGCMFKQNASAQRCLYIRDCFVIVNRYTVEGGGVSPLLIYATGVAKLLNGAQYGGSSYGYYVNDGNNYLQNVNIGVEVENGDADINMLDTGIIKGVDVKLGGNNGYVNRSDAYPESVCQIENYQKVLGKHRKWQFFGESEDIAVTDTNANKKLSDNVLKISPNIDSIPIIDDWKGEVFVGNFDLDAGAHTIKYWFFNDTGDTLNDTAYNDNVFLEGKYIDSYDDTTEYTITSCFSPEIDIVQAANADAWIQLSLAFTLATAGRVKVYLRFAKYEATAYALLDPEAVIT